MLETSPFLRLIVLAIAASFGVMFGNKEGNRAVITVANRIYVTQEYADAFEQRFRERAGLVDQMPGFISNLVIKGTTTSGSHNVAAGEAISLELVATTYGRGIVTSNRRDVQVTASIINTLTGETTSHIIMANTEGDFH